MNDSLWLPDPPIRGRTLDKLLCKRLGLPRHWVHPWLRRHKRAALASHLKACRALVPVEGSPLDIEAAAGHRFFTADTLPGWEGVRQFALARLEAARREAATAVRAGNPRKGGFLRTIADGDELVRHRDCLQLMLSPELLAAAARYLGSVPQLGGAALWWTPPNDSARRSQLWHLDDEDHHQVKILINLTDTGPEQGPFTLLPAALSTGITEDIRRSRPLGHWRRLGRITDEQVDQAGGRGQAIRATGPAGTGLIVDSSACLHHGSRGNTADRLVLMFHFLTWDTPLTSTYRYRREGALPDLSFTPMQRAALGYVLGYQGAVG